MKVDLLKFGATIPTHQYGNIMPEIVLSDVDQEEGTRIGVKFLEDLFRLYSEKGELKRNEINISLTKRSFNEEVDIVFDPVNHTYYHGDNRLISSTGYIKKFFKEFDEETISEVSAKAWGVEQSELKDLWAGNRDVTSSFGTVVHNALEFYHNFKELGETISKKKELEDNYALPKHPIIRSIILGLAEIDNRKGTLMSEVLITSIADGICGHADGVEIIDSEKKICRISDYKVNVSAEEIDRKNKVLKPFDNLPSNKLSKYQLQMSIYANMLEKSGWTVEGLDVFVLEDEWKHYELPVLKVI